jgi:transposase-like protein
MAHSVLSEVHFQNEAAAFAYVEANLWPNGPVCHHCGERDRIGRLAGKTTRPGLYKCYACKKPFTVRMGSVFESSHLSLHLWLQIIHLMCASKKGISTRQIQRMLRCSMKTAWFLGHRIREAMNDNPSPFFSPLGGAGATVEADATFRRPQGGTPRLRGPRPQAIRVCAGPAQRQRADLPRPERHRQHPLSDHRPAHSPGKQLHD